MARAEYIGVNNVARRVAKDYEGVNGVARRTVKAYEGVDGVARPYFGGIFASELAVGESVYLRMGSWVGKPREFIVVHQGNPDPSIYHESCVGTWLLMKEPYTNIAWASESIGYPYPESAVHAACENLYMNQFWEELNNIKQVKIPYYWTVDLNNIGNEGHHGDAGLDTHLFLLSGYELGIHYVTVPDGAVLDYFADGEKEKRIAYRSGAAVTWWTRGDYSPSGYAVGIDTNGNNTKTGKVYTYGFRPALIIHSDTLVDPETKCVF